VEIWIGIESSLKLLGIDFAVLVKDMCIYLCNHVDFSVARVALGCFQVAMVQLQLIGSAGMPLRYNYDKPEKPRISRVFGYLARFFILFQTEKSSREVVIS